MTGRIDEQELHLLKTSLQPLVGTQFPSLSLPIVALEAFEPSQIGTIVGSLMDALIPRLPDLPQLGLTKHEGILGDREGYPDYRHNSGKRLELKLLYVDNPALKMKKPPTPREPSARLTQKVTVKNVDPANDAMLPVAYRMEPCRDKAAAATPTIIDLEATTRNTARNAKIPGQKARILSCVSGRCLEVLSMIELVEARDRRMIEASGRWFGNFETPTIPSEKGRTKLRLGVALDISSYGRKESEGKDFNEDTNFGKLKRIPDLKLQAFLGKHRLGFAEEEEPNLFDILESFEKTEFDEPIE